MIEMTRPTSAKRSILLTGTEGKALEHLYIGDGAWTPQEAQAALGTARTRELIDHNFLSICDTDIGPLILLMAEGRVAVFSTSGRAQSLGRQLDRAYVRLCLLKLGWTATRPGETRENLWQYDTTGRMAEVRTPDGLALVNGSLRNGGMGRQSIANIATRLRSQALLHNFQVVILTPSKRKGKQKAITETAYLTVKTVLPINPAYPEVKRVKQIPTSRVVDNTPYLSGESWKEDPRLTALPDLTKQILQLRKSERIDHALQSLDCDGALSDAQLKKYYGLDVADLSEKLYVSTIVRPTHSGFANEVQVMFTVASRAMSNLDDSGLSHRVGTAEMRHLMGVFSDERHWKSEHRELLKFEEPDAYYYDDEGMIHAIEFDTGSYSANVIDDKLTTFADRGFTGTHWGVTTPRRQLNLTDKIRSRLESDIVVCEWWKKRADGWTEQHQTHVRSRL